MVVLRKAAMAVVCVCLLGLSACAYDIGCKGEIGGPQECHGTISSGGGGNGSKPF